jgi:hypothetical protein
MCARHHEVGMRISIDVQSEKDESRLADGHAEQDRARPSTQMNADSVFMPFGIA